MKRSIALLAFTAAALTGGCSRQQTLFNGKSLDGWNPCLADAAVAPAQVWSVKDGVMRCEGKPHGYIRTTKEFSDYQLHVEWRWPETPTNSGVLLHVTGPDKVWPPAIEAQLQTGAAGDLVTMRPGTSITVQGVQYTTPEGKSALVIPKQHAASEKPAGQWNSYDILCLGDTVSLYVNGVQQNTGTKSSLKRGAICLQSEGSPIEFRNIFIKPLK